METEGKVEAEDAEMFSCEPVTEDITAATLSMYSWAGSCSLSSLDRIMGQIIDETLKIVACRK